MRDVMQTFFGFSSVPKIVRGTEFPTVNVEFLLILQKLEKVFK